MKKSVTLAILAFTFTYATGQKIASVEIEGQQLMTSGKDHDTAFANAYSLILRDAKGNLIESASLQGGYTVTWDIDGFKTENDMNGQYCDSYGSFSVNGKESLSTTFELRNTPMNFVGNMTATLTLGKKKYVASKYVASLSMPQATQEEAKAEQQHVEVANESYWKYDVTVAYTGVLMAGYLNENLPGYELGRQETADTVTYEVPCMTGKIDLTAVAGNGVAPSITYLRITRQLITQPRAKPKVHHIGDSTSANRGSWAHHLLELIREGKYPELTELCDVCNDGAGGRNLRTYYMQGKFAKVLCDICPGDVLMIGNMGTNGMNKNFEEDLNLYIDIAEHFGAQIVLNSYTPHGAVSRWEKGYNPETQTFDSYRRDQYDEVVRKEAAKRAMYDASFLGFVEIGKNADQIFNAYVDDYKMNGYESRDAAARAIIACFTDHNHYSNGTLACELMLDGYGGIPGIVAQMTQTVGQ